MILNQHREWMELTFNSPLLHLLRWPPKCVAAESVQAGDAPSPCYDLWRLKWCMANHWGRWQPSLLLMFFPRWRLVAALDDFAFQRRAGAGMEEGIGESHQETFRPGSASSHSLSLFYLLNSTWEGFTFESPMQGRIVFPIFELSSHLSQFLPGFLLFSFCLLWRLTCSTTPYSIKLVSSLLYLINCLITVNKNNIPLSHNFKRLWDFRSSKPSTTSKKSL